MQHILQKHVIAKIKHIIENKGISQKELGDKLSISRQQVSKYLTLRTELTLRMIEEICDALDILPGQLFTDYYSNSISESDVIETISESDVKYKSAAENKYQSDIIRLQKRIKELEKIQNILQRIVEIVDSQYQQKCVEVDKLEMMLSEANRDK